MNNIIHAPVFIKQLPHATRLTWLKAMSDAGFPLIKIWGCSPRDDLRLPVEKNGETQMRLRCFCYSGRKGISCKNEGKHPIEGKDKNKSFRINYSYEVARRTPKLNWGVPTGEQAGIVVIDIDSDKGGYESLQALLANPANGELPPTFAVLTGGGTQIRGKHLFFKHPGADWHIKSLADHPELGIGIDVKGEGGYVVAAGSLHHSGNYYRPEADLSSSADITLADIPEWLLKKIGKLKSELPAQAAPLTPEQIKAIAAQFRKMKASGNSRGLEKWAESALQGECETVLSATSHGNQTQVKAGFRIGGIVGAGLLNYTDALAALLDAANARGGKSSGPAARRSIENGLRAGMLHPRFPTPKDEQVKTALDIALEEWIAAGGKASSLITVLKPEYFEVVIDANDNWDVFDAAFGSTLERERELEQSDPEGYAQWCEDEAERHRNSEADRFDRPLTSKERRSGGILCSNRGNNNATESQPSRSFNDAIPWNRCTECIAFLRPCSECAKKKLDTIRDVPDESLCTSGGVHAFRGKQNKRRGGWICLKCGGWGCPKCGFENECDYLTHHVQLSEWMNDLLEQPQIGYPSHDIESTETKFVNIQHGVRHVVIHDEKVKEGFGNKMTKLATAGLIDYRINFDRVDGMPAWHYSITLLPGTDEKRLHYFHRATGTRIVPTVVTFRSSDQLHRLLLGKYGRSIKLAKLNWDMIDAPLEEQRKSKVRRSYNAVGYNKRTAIAKRTKSTGKNGLVGKIPNQEHHEAVMEKRGVGHKTLDPTKIDKSKKRGLSMMVLGLGVYDFPDDMPDSEIDAFFDELVCKDKIVEVAIEPQKDEKGSACHQLHQLIT